MELENMMNHKLKFVLLASLLPFTVSAAQELTPWYIGGGLGVNNYEPNCDLKTTKVCGEDDPYAWDIFAGYMFNDYFGIELGYRNLGRAEWTDYSNKLNDLGVKGTTLGLVGVWPIANNWSLSVEAGAMNYLISNNKQWGSEYYSDSGIAPYFGTGIGYNFTENLKLQAKYRRYENLDEDKWGTFEGESNYWGLELSYRFGHTVAAAPVAAAVIAAAPVDSDNDGVYDDKDQCPATPATHKVDSVGCTIYENVKNKEDVGSIQFANDSAVVKPVFYKDIERLANYLNKNPEFTVEIAGHASNVGKPEYNMVLSDKRADAVAKILVEKYGISQSRVTSNGYGVTQPLVAGDSKEAHAANRRIEAVVTTTAKQPVLK
ncbi:OmpA family protein [Shewanella baltica]|uniref:OmpA family protein n=1 Tax=Shewanella TaxID=22 RepID=UPI001CF2E4BF|nr:MULTISPECIES: OmpA family protein [Shewanella]MCB2381890.1 OmpA family protein [Shewanella sp. SR1]MCS6117328.1 OmpA family protein [Shewanella baltica]